jgi:hypothetical protein
MKLDKFKKLELNELEMREISGGNWWSDFKAGLKAGFECVMGFVEDLLHNLRAN